MTNDDSLGKALLEDVQALRKTIADRYNELYGRLPGGSAQLTELSDFTYYLGEIERAHHRRVAARESAKRRLSKQPPKEV